MDVRSTWLWHIPRREYTPEHYRQYPPCDLGNPVLERIVLCRRQGCCLLLWVVFGKRRWEGFIRYWLVSYCKSHAAPGKKMYPAFLFLAFDFLSSVYDRTTRWTIGISLPINRQPSSPSNYSIYVAYLERYKPQSLPPQSSHPDSIKTVNLRAGMPVP